MLMALTLAINGDLAVEGMQVMFTAKELASGSDSERTERAQRHELSKSTDRSTIQEYTFEPKQSIRKTVVLVLSQQLA